MSNFLVTFGIFLVKLIGAVSKLLPSSVIYSITTFISSACFRFISRPKMISYLQLKKFLQVDSKTANEIQNRMYKHVGQSLADILYQQEILASELITHDEQTKDILKLDKGAIVLSAHYGCFELLASFYAYHGKSFAAFGRKPNYQAFADWLSIQRESSGIKTIWRDDPKAINQIVKCIKNNSPLAALIDQDIDIESEFSIFFGEAAQSPISPIRIAIKYNLDIYYSFIQRTGQRQHKVISGKIERPNGADEKEVIISVLEQYNRNLERVIRDKPEQWLWWHKRWRRKPGVDYQSSPELLQSTQKYIEWLAEA